MIAEPRAEADEEEEKGSGVRLVGRGIVGPTIARADATRSAVLADPSDTAANVVLGESFGVGSGARFAAGALVPSSDVADVFAHRIYGTVRMGRVRFSIGRMRLPTRHLMLPTFRDDDLLAFSDLRNPFAGSQGTRTTQYGAAAALRLDIGELASTWLYAESLARDEGATPPPPIVDRLGGDVVLERKEHGRRADVDHVALGARATRIADERWLPAILASAAIHRSTSSDHFVEARVQGIYASGDARAAAASMAPELAGVLALRYLHRPSREPKVQVAAVATSRRTTWSDGGSHFGVLVNALYRIGPSLDAGVQAQHEWLSGSLATVGPASRDNLQLTIMYTFDVGIVGRAKEGEEGRSLLDLEHAHVP